MYRFIFIILLCSLQAVAWGQQTLKPEGFFNRDTARLGELLQYTLVHRHPAAQEVVLPPDSYNFAPFELVRKEYFTTSTKAGISTDSAVYTLRTFEIEPLQQLALPVYVLGDRDTTLVYGEADAIVLQQLVTTVQEPLQMQADTNLAMVEERFNWPVLVLWITAVATFLTLVWLIFGQAIRRKYKLYRLRKDHVYFASRYNSHEDRFKKTGAIQSLEKAVTLWKNYLTKLERSAINSFTTKEIVEYYENDEEVNTALRICDKAIYGNVQTETEGETNLALGMLRRFAKSRHKTQRELIRNAKYTR